MEKDIILIGMPGCGKSTIGRMLANAMNRPFLDLDIVIEEMAGKTINRIFEDDGETVFRDMETLVLKQSVGQGGVLATGGGVVTIPRNQEFLEDGIVVFLDRPLSILLESTTTEERPLLKEGREKLKNLYEVRYDLYCQWADVQVKNSGTAEDAVRTILKEVEQYENYGN